MTLEVKTVNHRFLDLSFRLPRNVGFLEEMLHRELASGFQRGHMDVFVAYLAVQFRRVRWGWTPALAGAYGGGTPGAGDCRGGRTAQRSTADGPAGCGADHRGTGGSGGGGTAGKIGPGQVTTQVRAMRAREGDALRRDLTEHLDALAQLRERMAARAPQVPQAYQERLTARLAELAVEPVEPQRLAQEVAIFADKCAIDEELSRLASHIAQMRACLDEDGAVGRRLDFLTQEMNREVNTIGSKASDLEITQAVVAAKSEIEKLREQVQNVE